MFEGSITGQNLQAGILILRNNKSDRSRKCVGFIEHFTWRIYGTKKQKEIHNEAETEGIED